MRSHPVDSIDVPTRACFVHFTLPSTSSRCDFCQLTMCWYFERPRDSFEGRLRPLQLMWSVAPSCGRALFIVVVSVAQVICRLEAIPWHSFESWTCCGVWWGALCWEIFLNHALDSYNGGRRLWMRLVPVPGFRVAEVVSGGYNLRNLVRLLLVVVECRPLESYSAKPSSVSDVARSGLQFN